MNLVARQCHATDHRTAARAVIRLGLFDDQDIVRAWFKHILERHQDITICAEGATGHEALAAVRHVALDVCLVDLAMPDLSGLDVLRHIRSLQPALGILIFSSYPGEQYGLSILKAGANGFLSKALAPPQLIDAVRAAAAKCRRASPTA